MVEARAEIAASWVMTSFNVVFLSGRLYLRRNLRKGYRLSDYILITACVIVLVATSLITWLDMIEIRFLDANPKHPPNLDPTVKGISGPEKIKYGKILYALIHLNIFGWWTTKASFLAFFYEIFPKDQGARTIRRVLHACAIYMLVTFLYNLFSTIFWCYPLSSTWTPTAEGRICSLKLDRDYTSAAFATHISSIIFVAIIPLLLLGKVQIGRRETVFSLTVFGLGALSVGAAIASFVTLQHMAEQGSRQLYSPSTRHAVYVSSVADLDALFMAATLSAMRLTMGQRQTRPVKNGDDQTPLVIEVEKSYTVQVEIVQSWGQRGRDPATGRPMGFGHGNDIEVAQLTSASSRRTPPPGSHPDLTSSMHAKSFT